MLNIKKVEIAREENYVQYGTLKPGEGFRHPGEKYLCIKTQEGHMYQRYQFGEHQNSFNGGGACDPATKVAPVDIELRWNDVA